MILILGFQLLTTFGLLNIVVAAVVDGTMNCSDEFVLENKTMKETLSHLQVVRDIFEKAAKLEPGSDGYCVTSEQLIPVLLDPEIRRRLLTMTIAYDDPSQIYRTLDADGTGSVDLTELARGLLRMRGNAKSKDILAVRALIYRCHHEIRQELKMSGANFSHIIQIEGKLDSFVADAQGQFQKLADMIARVASPAKSVETVALGSPSAKVPKYAADMTTARRNQEFREQIGKIGARIDNLVSMIKVRSGTGKVVEGTSTQSDETNLVPQAFRKANGWNDVGTSAGLNRDIQSSLSMSVNIGLQECHRQEYSWHLEQLQQEYQMLQQWLAVAPMDEDPRWTRLLTVPQFPRGDRPLEADGMNVADGRPVAPGEAQDRSLQRQTGLNDSLLGRCHSIAVRAGSREVCQ